MSSDPRGPSREDVFLPFPGGVTSRAQVPVATQFRSTWLSSSLRALKARQRYEDYLRLLAKEHHDAVASVAGVWLPVKVAVAHYQACDALGFTAQEQFAIGFEVHTYTQATIFGTIAKLATGAGASPWTALSKFNFLWERTWIGGGTSVVKLGPKEVQAEIAGWPCAGTPYIRHAMRGVMQAMVSLFCQKVYVAEMPRLCSSLTLGYRIAWV